MSVFNNHTQIYPANGTVVNRIYDRTGQFNIVVNQEKSRHNEKKIHNIIMNNKKLITITQIAGFLPRCITSSDIIPEKVKAGQYLGMIKFGSRIDITFPGNISKLKIKVNDSINIGDDIYTY
jgi:phosphatidylserine decarboxylase